MTGDVNVSSADREEKCGLDTGTAFQDLHQPAAGDGNENGIGEGDASYVFVNGNANAAADDAPVETADLNAKCLASGRNVGSGDCEHGKEGGTIAAVVESESLEIGDQGRVEGVLHSTKGVIQGAQADHLSRAVEIQPHFLHANGGEANVEEEDGLQSPAQAGETHRSHVAASEMDQTSKDVEGERTSDLSADTAENLDCPRIIANSVQNELDSDQDKEPTELIITVPVDDSKNTSGVDLNPTLDSALYQGEETVSIDGPTSAEYGDGLLAGNTQDSIAKTAVGDHLVGANQNMGDQSSSSEKIELFKSSDSATGKIFVTATDDDTMPTPVVQLEAQVDKNGEVLPTSHAQGSVSETVQVLPTNHAQENVFVDDFVHASQTTPRQTSETIKMTSIYAVSENEQEALLPITDIVAESDVVTEDRPAEDETVLRDNMGTLNKVERLDVSNEFVDSHTVDKETEIGLPVAPSFPAIDAGCLSIESAKILSSFSSVDTNRESEVPIGVVQCALSNSETKLETETEIETETIQSCPVLHTMSGIQASSLSILSGDKVSVSSSGDVDGESEVSLGVAKCVATDAKLETEAESVPVVNDRTPSCPDIHAKPEILAGSLSIESEEKASISSSGDVNGESEVPTYDVICVGSREGETTQTNDSAERKSRMPTCPVDAGVDSEVGKTPMEHSKDVPPNDNTPASESKGPNGSTLTNENDLHCVRDGVHVEFGSINDNAKICQEVEGADGVHWDEKSASVPESSTLDTSDVRSASEMVKRPFYYLIKIPRYDDENLKEEISRAQIQVDEKTKSRDAIQANIQMKKVKCQEYGDSFDNAMSEEKAARDLHKAKRKEIDSLQYVINTVRNATDCEEIDGRIHHMEHMMQHETLPLKEEKQFIREIKQLKQIRVQLFSNMGSQEKIQQALDQKDQVEQQLKVLKKEADLLREKVLKAETATQDAKKKFNDEIIKRNELISQFNAANEIRQQAYANLVGLKRQSSEKRQHFWKYKNDAKVANELALKGDKDELQNHCVNQVERVMELWNNSDGFRKEYIRCNMRSTLRRLRTLDGRSLGPDEEPPVVPNLVIARVVAKENTVPLPSTLKGEKFVASEEMEKPNDKSTEILGDQKNQAVVTRKPVKPAPVANGSATVSGREEIEELRQEDDRRTEEEEELSRMAKELRKEEEAARLKEQRRLEEKAKAKEARERKKRNADKAEARAALKAQKEAEQKEKEREKRARKKEKRKEAAEDTNGIYEGGCGLGSEAATEIKESGTEEKPAMVMRRTQKPSQLTKQSKAKSMPLTLRNRGKRRMRTWMWALVVMLAAFALFFMGNGSFFFNFELRRFGF